MSWVSQALAIAPERVWLSLPHARLEVLCWGRDAAEAPPDTPGVLLLHGYAANADWWCPIAPHLARGRRVVAFSFSGMGQSDWCAHYTLPAYAAEIAQVAQAMGLWGSAEGGTAEAAPVLVAHSFGGFCALYAAAQEGAQWGGLVLIDSRVDNSLADLTGPDSNNRQTPRFVDDPEELIRRFRLAPAQECQNPEALAAVGRRSVRQMAQADGQTAWCRAADPNLIVDFAGVRLKSLLPQVRCPMAYLVGERSYILQTGVYDDIAPHFPPGAWVATIPDAAHHAILDQPVAVAGMLDLVLGAWQRRVCGPMAVGPSHRADFLLHKPYD